MKITDILKSKPAQQSHEEFFRERAARVQTIEDFDKQIAETNRAIDTLCEAPPAKGKPAQLGALRATAEAAAELRDRAAADLAAHDKGFDRAARGLLREITTTREACLEGLAAAIEHRLAELFAPEEGLDPNQIAERRGNITGILPRTIQIRTESRRHFPLLTPADVGGVQAWIPRLPALMAELDACKKRLGVIVEIRDGKRPLTANLAEFESPECQPAPAKPVREGYNPPEALDHFAARRVAAIRQFEHVAGLAAMREGLSKSDLEDLGRVVHPDRDPAFRRDMGTP